MIQDVDPISCGNVTLPQIIDGLISGTKLRGHNPTVNRYMLFHIICKYNSLLAVEQKQILSRMQIKTHSDFIDRITAMLARSVTLSMSFILFTDGIDSAQDARTCTKES
jgi:hypothetical protein